MVDTLFFRHHYCLFVLAEKVKFSKRKISKKFIVVENV